MMKETSGKHSTYQLVVTKKITSFVECQTGISEIKPHMIPTPNEISWIIGLHRQGNSPATISLITGYPPTQIEKIVKEYLNKKGETA